MLPWCVGRKKELCLSTQLLFGTRVHLFSRIQKEPGRSGQSRIKGWTNATVTVINIILDKEALD